MSDDQSIEKPKVDGRVGAPVTEKQLAARRANGRRLKELKIGIFAPGVHEKAGRASIKTLSVELKSKGGYVATHIKHHIAKGVTNPNCPVCSGEIKSKVVA